MGLINILRGNKNAARTIAEIEAALARLVSERNIAKEAIASALAERDSLLLEDESDSRINKLDSSTDKARLTVERCDKLEPILLQELAAARGTARQAQWATLRSKYDSASTDFVHKARAAIAALEALPRIRGEAQLTGFAAEAGSFLVAPNVLATDLIAAFEFAVESQRDATARKPAPKPAPAVPKATQAPKPTPAAPKATAAPVAPRPAPEPFTPPEPAADGTVRITILRPGVEIAGRGRRAAEVVSLPPDEAYRIVSSGAADYASEAAA